MLVVIFYILCLGRLTREIIIFYILQLPKTILKWIRFKLDHGVRLIFGIRSPYFYVYIYLLWWTNKIQISCNYGFRDPCLCALSRGREVMFECTEQRTCMHWYFSLLLVFPPRYMNYFFYTFFIFWSHGLPLQLFFLPNTVFWAYTHMDELVWIYLFYLLN